MLMALIAGSLLRLPVIIAEFLSALVPAGKHRTIPPRRASRAPARSGADGGSLGDNAPTGRDAGQRAHDEVLYRLGINRDVREALTVRPAVVAAMTVIDCLPSVCKITLNSWTPRSVDLKAYEKRWSLTRLPVEGTTILAFGSVVLNWTVPAYPVAMLP